MVVAVTDAAEADARRVRPRRWATALVIVGVGLVVGLLRFE